MLDALLGLLGRREELADLSAPWPGFPSLRAAHVDRLFGFVLERRWRCTVCADAAAVQRGFSQQRVLRLPPPPVVERSHVWTATELYYLSCAPRSLDEFARLQRSRANRSDDAWLKCSRCGGYGGEHAQHRMLTQPNVLLLHVGRSEGTAGAQERLRFAVQPGRELSLPGHDRYELQAVVYRRGGTAATTHYYCVVRCHDARWWRFGDAALPRVSHGDLERSELRSVHLLVYTRRRGQTRFAQMGPAVPAPGAGLSPAAGGAGTTGSRDITVAPGLAGAPPGAGESPTPGAGTAGPI
jgi:ubiquitin C-terminal hydrolase